MISWIPVLAGFLAFASPVFAVPQTATTKPPASSAASSVASNTSTAGAASGTGGPFSNARMTWYNTSLGACGQNNTDSELVVALASAQFASGAGCNKTVEITAGSTTATATVKDLCGGCPDGGIDLTPSLFVKLAPLPSGTLTGGWSFNGGGGANSSGAASTTAGASQVSSSPAASTT